MTVFEDRTCPADECDYVLPENTPLCEHYIRTHTNLPADFTPDSFTNIIFSIWNSPDQFHQLIRLNPSIASHFPLYLSVPFLHHILLSPISCLNIYLCGELHSSRYQGNKIFLTFDFFDCIGGGGIGGVGWCTQDMM